MAHQIFSNRVMVADKPAWHGLGTVFNGDENLTAVQGLTRIEGDDPVVISMLPALGFQVPGYGMWNPENSFKLIRHPMKDDPKPVDFGDVKGDYSLLQNNQIAQLVDILLEATSWRLETIGILNEGRDIFFSCKNGDTTIAGDDVAMFFNVSDQRNGASAIDLSVGLTRIVCWNTLQMSLKNNSGRVTLRHHRDLFLETSWRMTVIRDLVNAGESMVGALRRLEQVEISQDRAFEIVNEVFPMPKAPKSIDLKAAINHIELVNRGEKAEYKYGWQCQQVEINRNNVLENFTYNTDLSGKSTGWELYNALTGAITHQMGKETVNGRRVAAERDLSVQASDLRGKCYELIMATK